MNGESGDNVIRLETFLFLACDVEGFGRTPGQRYLRAQVFGHFVTVGFIQVIHLVAKRVAALVENDRDMRRCIRSGVAFNIALQHVAKSGDGTYRQAIRLSGQGWQRMIGTENKRRPVNQMQMVTFAKCAGHIGAP